MMSGPYYGGGGYGGVQMAQPANVGGDEGNYVNGGFDQGAAEARQAFPMGGFAPYQAESLQDAVDKVWGTRGGVEEFFTSAQNSQTGRGTSSGQGSQDGGGRGGESEGGERKRQGARAGGSGLYTAEDHMEMERRRGEAAQRGQGLLPGRQDSQGKGGGLPKGQTVFLVDGTAVNIDDATVEMGALGTNQIPYPDLSQRQKVVRDLSVKRMRERERAGGSGEQETVIAMSYAVMRAHETQKAKCVNCHVAPRTRDGNDHECSNHRECNARVWEAMQRTKVAPAAARPQHQANNRQGRNANRRDRAKAPQGSRNAIHGW